MLFYPTFEILKILLNDSRDADSLTPVSNLLHKVLAMQLKLLLLFSVMARGTYHHITMIIEKNHSNDVIMSAMASQIIGVWTVYSGADQGTHQSIFLVTMLWGNYAKMAKNTNKMIRIFTVSKWVLLTALGLSRPMYFHIYSVCVRHRLNHFSHIKPIVCSFDLF